MTTPPPTPAPDPTPPAPDQQAQHEAAMDAEIRDLAAQIAAMTKLPFDPTVIRKAIITAVTDNAAPPTVSLNISGDEETLVTQVRCLNNYTPLVGNTVLLAKQGAEIFILGQIAGTNPYGVGAAGDGWVKCTLSNGSHGGNSNGDIYFRRILDHGAWKMQWRGGWVPSGSTAMVDTGQALDPDYRPSSKRSVLCAREVGTGATAAQFDFLTDGRVTLVGSTAAPIYTDNDNVSFNTNSSSPSVSITVGGTSTSSNQNQNHTHVTSGVTSSGANVGHSHDVSWGDTGSGTATHSHFVPSGTHHHNNTVTVSAPAWVSLNGVEYFL